jgi:hypothetical protein
MSTAVFELSLLIPERIAELETLNRHAEKVLSENAIKNEALYNILCRSCCVLLASQLEGFLKDLTKALVHDLNYNLNSFSKMPKVLQRSFCERIAFYDGVELKEIEDKIKQLIAFFEKNPVPIDLYAFPYKQNPNKNASYEFIDKSFSKIGIPNIMLSLAKHQLEDIFENDKQITFVLRRDIKKYKSLLFRFPYKNLPSEYKFNHVSGKLPPGLPQTLWETFIEDIMTRRHKIAHGETLANETTHEDIGFDIQKLEVMMHGIMFSATTYISSIIPAAP